MRKYLIFVFVAVISTFIFMPNGVFAKENENSTITSYFITTKAEYDSKQSDINNGVSANIPTDYQSMVKEDNSTKGTSKPTVVWNLSTQGMKTFSGGTAYNDLYTNNLYTGVTSVRVVLNATKNHSLDAQLWQRRTGLFQSDLLVETFPTVQVGYTTTAFVFGLSSSANYYIKFIAPAYFTGSIEAN